MSCTCGEATWEMCQMSGEVPSPMSGTCGCSLNGDMYIFGGCNDNGQTNQLYCVKLLDGKYSWRKVNHKSGSSPSPRDKLSCWVFNGRLIYFAGYGHKQLDDISNNRSFLMDEASRVDDIYWGWNNEVHMFDPTSASWSEPHTSGRAPDPRAAHASATLGNKGYVCGGRIRESRTSDIYCLDLESWTWSEMICEDYIAKNVKNCKLLQKQLPCMPPKLLPAVQRRMSFFQTSRKI
ncbi:kelch domain-containing protein 1-like isoform 2-T3 [Salvelinus alpinus]